MKRITILADGDFPRGGRALEALRSAEYIICCDGAAKALVNFGMQPDMIVGDIDSLPASLQEQFAGIIRHCTGQDDNDLTKAMRQAVEMQPESILILGATGKREDHTLANISLLADYLEMAAPATVEMLSDFGRFEVRDSSGTFNACPGQEISIFSFDQTLNIHAEGLEYPTDNVVFDSLWKASLNRALQPEFTLELNHRAPYIVYSAF